MTASNVWWDGWKWTALTATNSSSTYIQTFLPQTEKENQLQGDTKMQLFQYAVYYAGQEDGAEAEKPEVVVDLTVVLARDESHAGMIAGRAIPDKWAERLHELEVVVVPFDDDPAAASGGTKASATGTPSPISQRQRFRYDRSPSGFRAVAGLDSLRFVGIDGKNYEVCGSCHGTGAYGWRS